MSRASRATVCGAGGAVPLLTTADKVGETLDGIAEPGPVARTPTVAIG